MFDVVTVQSIKSLDRPLPSLLCVHVSVIVGEMLRTVSPGVMTPDTSLKASSTGVGATTSMLSVSVIVVAWPAKWPPLRS